MLKITYDYIYAYIRIYVTHSAIPLSYLIYSSGAHAHVQAFVVANLFAV